MLKKLITITTISICCSYGFAQPILQTQPHIEQKTFLVNSNDKNKVHEFQEKVRITIDKHRTEMHARKEVLEREKESLRNEVRLARQQNQGKLTEQQKTEFKARLSVIENKSVELRKDNFDFISQIDKERESFFSTLKNKPNN